MSEKNGVVCDGYVRIENGKIAELGLMGSLCGSQGEEIVDVQGCDLYPGFIDSHTHLGMFPDSQSYKCEDANETGGVATPNLRALDSVNPMDRCVREALLSGITVAVVSPGSSNPIAGQVVAMKTFGKRIDDMILKAPVAMKFALGENPKNDVHSRGKSGNAIRTRMGVAAEIRRSLTAARMYMKKKESRGIDYAGYCDKCEALIPLLKGDIPAHFHAHRADDIFTAVRISKEFGLRCTMIHATEAYKIIEELVEENVNLMVGPFFCDRSKPELSGLDIVKMCRNLAENDIKFSIMTDHPVMPSQYLGLSVGLALSVGTERLRAIRSVTVDAAEICGIGEFVGSLDVGKHADILVFQGDPFSVEGRKPKMVICNGHVVK
jgi:imidazolonepropionase-like amidohydrolase